MTRRSLLIAATLVLASAGLLFWLASPSDGAASPGGGSLPGAFAGWTDRDNSRDNNEAAMSEEQRHAAVVKILSDRLREWQQQPGNLQALLTALRAHCHDDLSCNALMDEVLAAHPDQELAAMLSRLLSRLPSYEKAMQSVTMSMSVPPRERYARIQALRQQMLGVAETELAFGQERAYADYQFGYGDLLAQAGTMTPSQRLAALDDLRERAWGDYATPLQATEGKDGAYERERELLLVGVTDPAQQQQITDALRVKHYGKEQAQQMAARDAVVSEQKKVVATYQQEAAALKQDMDGMRATLSESQWQALYEERLTALRLKHFP